MFISQAEGNIIFCGELSGMESYIIIGGFFGCVLDMDVWKRGDTGAWVACDEGRPMIQRQG